MSCSETSWAKPRTTTLAESIATTRGGGERSACATTDDGAPRRRSFTGGPTFSTLKKSVVSFTNARLRKMIRYPAPAALTLRLSKVAMPPCASTAVTPESVPGVPGRGRSDAKTVSEALVATAPPWSTTRTWIAGVIACSTPTLCGSDAISSRAAGPAFTVNAADVSGRSPAELVTITRYVPACAKVAANAQRPPVSEGVAPSRMARGWLPTRINPICPTAADGGVGSQIPDESKAATTKLPLAGGTPATCPDGGAKTRRCRAGPGSRTANGTLVAARIPGVLVVATRVRPSERAANLRSLKIAWLPCVLLVRVPVTVSVAPPPTLMVTGQPVTPDTRFPPESCTQTARWRRNCPFRAIFVGCTRKPSRAAAPATMLRALLAALETPSACVEASKRYAPRRLIATLSKVATPPTAATVTLPPICPPSGPDSSDRVTESVADATRVPAESSSATWIPGRMTEPPNAVVGGCVTNPSLADGPGARAPCAASELASPSAISAISARSVTCRVAGMIWRRAGRRVATGRKCVWSGVTRGWKVAGGREGC